MHIDKDKISSGEDCQIVLKKSHFISARAEFGVVTTVKREATHSALLRFSEAQLSSDIQR